MVEGKAVCNLKCISDGGSATGRIELTRLLYKIGECFVVMDPAIIENKDTARIRPWLHLWKLYVNEQKQVGKDGQQLTTSSAMKSKNSTASKEPGTARAAI
jgi:hypothetical protein